jgi:predicted kinase
MNKIIVMQGPPACGKSTLARKLHEANKSCVIVSRDSIRESRGDYWIPDQENWVSKVEEYQVRSAIECGLTPIIDATNLNPKTIAKWEKIAAETNAVIEYQECVLSFEEACKNDAARGNKVGVDVLKKFYNKYYPDLINCNAETRKMLPIDENKPKCILVDIDGTLALRTNRSPFEYEKVESDDCDFRMVELINSIKENCDYDIIFVTGREDIGRSRECTSRWLTKYFGEEEIITKNVGVTTNWTLKMRAAGDKRSDDIVKREIYEQKIAPWRTVVAVFDDRNKVVNMWRELGLLCLQVYPGDF